MIVMWGWVKGGVRVISGRLSSCTHANMRTYSQLQRKKSPQVKKMPEERDVEEEGDGKLKPLPKGTPQQKQEQFSSRKKPGKRNSSISSVLSSSTSLLSSSAQESTFRANGLESLFCKWEAQITRKTVW